MDYLNHRQLKQRGWTGTSVRLLLKRPDKRVPIPGQRPVELFEVERVQRVEEIHPYFNLPYRECRRTFRKVSRDARNERKNNRVDIESVDTAGSSVVEQASSKSNARPE